MHQEVSFPAISLLSADLGLACCTGFSPVAASRGRSPAVLRGLLTVLASLVVGHRLYGAQASVVVVHGLSYLAACGIFLDQGPNPRLLHWQADS